MNNNALVTGAKGFLGSVITSKLLEASYNTYTLGTKVDNNYQCNIAKEIPSFNASFDRVVHAAGKAHVVPKSESEKQEFFDINLQGTINLCKGLDNIEFIGSFIFISTVSVYGLIEGVDIKEDAPLESKEPYGLSKIKAEEFLLDWAKNKNISLTILRLPLIVGKNPLGNLGRMIQAFINGKYIRIGSAKAKKSMVDVNDVAHLITSQNLKTGIFNLTDGYHPSFLELENKLVEIFNPKTKIKTIPQFPLSVLGRIGSLAENIIKKPLPFDYNTYLKITKDLTFNDEKARRELGWNGTPVLNKLDKIL